MKRISYVITLLAATAMAVTVGCQKKPEPTAPTAEDSAAQLEKLKKKTQEAVDASRDYAYVQKAEYAAKIRSEVADLNKELDQLSGKIEASSTAAKDEAKAKLQAVREKVTRLTEKLDGVQSASEATWNDVQSGVKQAYDDVKSTFNQTRQWLAEKIKP